MAITPSEEASAGMARDSTDICHSSQLVRSEM